MNKLPLIEKILLLESRLGERWTHTNLEPFAFDGTNVIEVQKAAKIISKHLGLPPMTFVVSYSEQKPDVGGHIYLDSKDEVFIEIQHSFKHNHEIVLAVLAHEICHKYLQINNLKFFPEYENEMLTDAATVYTGLGKLSLNGCEAMIVSGDSRTEHKVGYMNKTQFAFLYRLVCAMRKTPEEKMFKGLNSSAYSAMHETIRRNDLYFNDGFFYNDYVLRLFLDSVKNDFDELLGSYAEFYRNIKIIREGVLVSANQAYKDFHRYNNNKINTLQDEINQTVKKDSHNYLKNIKAIEEIKFLKARLTERHSEMLKFNKAFNQFISKIDKNYSECNEGKTQDFLLLFKCPTCRKKMRIQEKKLAKVQCPQCNYLFIVDTREKSLIQQSQPELNINEQSKEQVFEVKKKKRSNFKDRVRKFFN